jgi:hypothetical protein
MNTKPENDFDFLYFATEIWPRLPVWKQKYLLFYCRYLLARHKITTFMAKPAVLIASSVFVAALAVLTFAR